MDLRGDWSSVCPALLRYPRRNQVAPGICVLPSGAIIPWFSRPGRPRTFDRWGELQIVQYFARVVDDRVRFPRGRVGIHTEVTVACRDHRHAGRTSGLDI